MMKHDFWIYIVNKLKRGESLDSSKLSTDEKDISSSDLQSDVEKIWNTIQYQASFFNPDKARAWKLINSRISKSVKTVTIPFKLIYRSVAVIILLIAISSLYIIKHSGRELPVTFQYATLNGKSKIDLPDGTQVWLAPNSEIIYASNFSPENRKIQIKGKAYLEVKKDSIHPFFVNIDQSLVKVYGTSFSINSTKEKLMVSLLSGKISFQKTSVDSPLWIKPGEAAVLNKNTGDTFIENVDAYFNALWAHEKLKIEEKNLGEVVKYLSQWYDVNITLDGNLKNKYKYTFTITTEQLDEVLRMMSRINPMEITYDKKNVNIK
ncbi:FecR family protein [Parabacteroides bouchesdurhonensis]|uniref:FecR family protein n=1 Tax=Parabacteroides bouchesdurhonensis TaxID=1936995 RepID=UPI000C85FC97|nr:FecR family protein [Parabacteroides bouchesdurhonensis]